MYDLSRNQISAVVSAISARLEDLISERRYDDEGSALCNTLSDLGEHYLCSSYYSRLEACKPRLSVIRIVSACGQNPYADRDFEVAVTDIDSASDGLDLAKDRADREASNLRYDGRNVEVRRRQVGESNAYITTIDDEDYRLKRTDGFVVRDVSSGNDIRCYMVVES